jgi:hypothetical protein
MCFSAGASFTASAFLFGTFLLSLRKAQGTTIKHLAYMPLFFTLQQATEGVIWLAAPEKTIASTIATYVFLFFALAWWPIWVNAVMVSWEKKSLRKYMLYPFLALAALMTSAGALLIYQGVSAQIVGCHVSYQFTISQAWLYYFDLYKILYLLATTLPFFISSIPKMWTLGIGIGVTYGISAWWYQDHLLSVWCFFGAIISCLVFYVVHTNSAEKQ